MGITLTSKGNKFYIFSNNEFINLGHTHLFKVPENYCAVESEPITEEPITDDSMFITPVQLLSFVVLVHFKLICAEFDSSK